MNPTEFFDQKIKLIAQSQEILDLGGGVKFSKELVAYKNLFANSHVRVLDSNPEVKPDILADAHQIPLADQSVDAVICKSLLEHVMDPKLVMLEIKRVLKQDGLCLIYLPFIYPYHGNKVYKDYFRFTIDGVKYLCEGFSEREIINMRGSLETLLYFLPRPIYQIFKMPLRILDNLLNKKSQTSGFMVFLKK